jgi:tRNA (adenine22-N1)-methyltransferase
VTSYSEPAGNLPPNLASHLHARVTERMKRIADFAIDHRPTWDLCCDHGLVGLWAWHTHSLPELHFVDRAPGLVDAIEQRLSSSLSDDRIAFHSRDASTLSFGEAPSNIFLSGVGFRASQRILAATCPATTPHRLVVSVHAEAERLHDAMEEKGWRLAGETQVEEHGRVRKISAWDGQAALELVTGKDFRNSL